MSATFQEFGLNPSLIAGLKKQNIEKPTDIQSRTIALALQNKDIIGQSQTGSGKTLAYLLPIMERIDSTKREMQAIVLAPTHELVMQIEKQIKTLAENAGLSIRSAAVIGQVNIERQVEKLREKPHIVVGSTGRVLELIKRKKITAHTIKTIVIDEGDRLLDEKNISVVKDIIKTTLRDRQLMVFSATINERTLSIAKDLMKEPEVIKIEAEQMLNPQVEHIYIAAEQREKIEVLRKLVAALKPARGIVFINKSDEVEITANKLKYHQISAYAISGAAEKEERKKALEDFRQGRLQLLIASDIAARGLDIQDVTHIFNLDLPEDPKEYLHRAGRTGRMGKSGMVISIATPKEIEQLQKNQKVFNIEIQEKEIYKGAVTEPGSKRVEVHSRPKKR